MALQKDFVCHNAEKGAEAFTQKFKALLNAVSFNEKSVHSVLLLIAYGVHIRSNKPISCFSNGKLDMPLKERFSRQKFELDLEELYKKYQKAEKETLYVAVAYNFEKDVFMNNFKKSFEKMPPADEDEMPLTVVPVEPCQSFDKMILQDSVREELLKVVTLVKNLDAIYNEWGFSKIDAMPRCIVNFFGPPGTGKTMAAHATARALAQKILPMNYSDIESKFWGDAPKKLASAFRIAEQENAVLFFDEADSFLGKRITNVSSSSDQAINSLRSQMLILLENFTGTVIFATNLHKNYDRAFESRILKHIEFFLPDAKLRAEIITKMIPEHAPVAESVKTPEFITKLGGIIEGFSPREIKNTVLDVLTTALYKEQPLDKTLFEEIFTAAKEKFDSLQDESGYYAEQKDRVQEKIKKQLASGDYETVTDSAMQNHE